MSFQIFGIVEPRPEPQKHAGRDWINGIMQHEAYVDDAAAFHQIIDRARMIRVVMEAGVRPHLGKTG